VHLLSVQCFFRFGFSITPLASHPSSCSSSCARHGVVAVPLVTSRHVIFILVHLRCWNSTNVDVLVNQLAFQEPLISEARKPQLKAVIQGLIAKLAAPEVHDFFLSKILRAHILPLTNCAFNKAGDKYVSSKASARTEAKPVYPTSVAHGYFRASHRPASALHRRCTASLTLRLVCCRRLKRRYAGLSQVATTGRARSGTPSPARSC
jgi:hypothetical protein